VLAEHAGDFRGRLFALRRLSGAWPLVCRRRAERRHRRRSQWFRHLDLGVKIVNGLLVAARATAVIIAILVLRNVLG